MKTTRHSLLAKGIMVLLSLLIMVFVFTYSWFPEKPDPSVASGLSLSVVNPSTDFEYAIGFSTSQTRNEYKHTEFTNTVNQNLNLEELYVEGEAHTPGNKKNLLYDYNPIDVTGDGVTLVRPAMGYGNWNVNTATDNYSIAKENEQYISFDLIFRTEVPNTTIRLDPASCARGNCETYAGDGSLTGAASGNDGSSLNYNPKTDKDNPESNKYGRFSRDAIVGAVRVAFLNYADDGTLDADKIVDEQQTVFESTPALLWIPRPDLFLNNGATDTSSAELANDSAVTGWTLDTNVNGTKILNSRSQQNASYSTRVHQYYNIFETLDENTNPKGYKTYDAAVASVLNTSAPNNTDKVVLGQQVNLTSLCYYNETDHKYYGKIRIRIWLEGTIRSLLKRIRFPR